ncbi:MAG: DNA recombination protein RmuC [Chlamydiae bacterium]|nr:DNA recombination protein RmuC [Chlamydiota bacterium]
MTKMIEIFVVLAVVGALFGFWMAFQRRLQSLDVKFNESLKSLLFDALEKNSRLFLDLSKGSLEKFQEGAKADLEQRQRSIESSIGPIRESLKQIDIHQRELEKQRTGAYAALVQQLESMSGIEKELRHEMIRLTQSLRSPQVRGSWGEIHLKRVIELAGMVNHCDFSEQMTVANDGKIWRPDVVIHLPGEKQIVIDAKTPLNAFLDASETEDEEIRKKKLQEHAMQLRRHLKELSLKEYWKQLGLSPEYVILFLPAEGFYSAALQVDPELIEVGADRSVLIATPTTLIAILRAVALTWKQENMSKNAQEIAQVGQDLYDRISIFCDHWNKVGKNLNSAVDSFNQSAASLESRVIVSARKLKETGQYFQKEIPEAIEVEKIARTLKT